MMSITDYPTKLRTLKVDISKGRYINSTFAYRHLLKMRHL
ncbi:hypothetical protein PROVRUST_06039 [Providencia rustigianii DSM 4541]|uniref:Uncharacterized protein n=1 Tax=Providencia rustigianii DSM 4541 TaxID=500637 RepID=D1P1G8_9GAMM|nr:hypothetical protein PROVRUST_06039 [Providencia rustigianii DSM 4541]